MVNQEQIHSIKRPRKSELLSSDDPIINVLSRRLAWESVTRGRGIDEIGEIGKYVQRIRYDLGLKGKGTTVDKWYEENKDEINSLTTAKKERAYNWRFLNLPSHLLIRTLASDPEISNLDTNSSEKLVSFDIVFGDPSVPALKIYAGTGTPESNEYVENRAIYILLHKDDSDALYIGKADNAEERMKQHKVKNPHYFFLAFPSDTKSQFNGDVRDATESLMIAFWSEIANVSNGNLGTTIKPQAAADFYMAISMTAAISAAYVYAVRSKSESINLALGLNNEKKLQIPFLSKEGRKINLWPQSYWTDPDPLSEDK